MTFKTWIIVEKREILNHIKIPLQSVRQTIRFSCGAAALRSIFQYYGVGPDEEQKFIDMMDSNNDDGTKPHKIVQMARKFGLRTKWRHNLTVAQLKKILDQERPVICMIQAWGDKKYYKTRDTGHYVVAIGYDEQHIYFEDPVLKGKRGYLSYDEFYKRWTDKDANGKIFDHCGIIIWKEGEDDLHASYLTRAKRIA